MSNAKKAKYALGCCGVWYHTKDGKCEDGKTGLAIIPFEISNSAVKWEIPPPDVKEVNINIPCSACPRVSSSPIASSLHCPVPVK